MTQHDDQAGDSEIGAMNLDRLEAVKVAIRSVTRDWMLESDLDVIALAVVAALDPPRHERIGSGDDGTETA